MDITHFVIATKNNFCNGAITLNNGKLIVFYKYLNYITNTMPYFNFSIRKGEKINEDSLCDFILNHSKIKQNELYSVIEKNLFKLM